MTLYLFNQTLSSHPNHFSIHNFCIALNFLKNSSLKIAISSEFVVWQMSEKSVNKDKIQTNSIAINNEETSHTFKLLTKFQKKDLTRKFKKALCKTDFFVTQSMKNKL